VVNGDNSDEVVVTSAPKKPWIQVHLTPREVQGLQLVIVRMKNWPKTNVPDGIENPDQLLDRLEVIHTTLAVKCRVACVKGVSLKSSRFTFVSTVFEKNSISDNVEKRSAIHYS
jgi:hypothetical protein